MSACNVSDWEWVQTSQVQEVIAKAVAQTWYHGGMFALGIDREDLEQEARVYCVQHRAQITRHLQAHAHANAIGNIKSRLATVCGISNGRRVREETGHDIRR